MTRENAIDIIKCLAWHTRPNEEDIEQAIEALEQQPCDCISRAWLKESIHNFYHGLKHTPTEEDIQAYIDAAPPVTPQPKTGQWIGYNTDKEGWKRTDGSPVFMICSECKGMVLNNGSAHYCSYCGARMEAE